MRHPTAIRLAVLLGAGTFAACSDPAPASTADTVATSGDSTTSFDSAAGKDAGGGNDAKADTAAADGAIADAVADSAGQDTTSADTAKSDSAGADAAVSDTAATDTAATDTAATDTAATDTAATDTAATDTAATDSAASDTAATDAGSADVGPAECSPGTLKRCWVECPIAYVSGCINAGLPGLIMGTQACSGGQWQPCATQAVCADLGGTCSNGTKLPATVLCTDGASKDVGGYLCTKPIGAQCNTSYYGSWPMADCPDLCSGPDDVCATAGEKRDCVATCGSTTGVTVKGTQNCNDYCNGKFWGPCLTDDACLKLAQ